jgi:PAS domain-containing protein
MVDQKAVKDLHADMTDLGRPSYEQLKAILLDVHELNTDSRFVYLMGIKEGKQFFYVDSEDPSSKDYSPPGQEYTDASETDLYNHTHGIAYTSGPYSDQWGTWISAYAPIINKDTDEVIALVGIDVDAQNLLSRIWLAQQSVIGVSSLVFLCIVLLIILIRRSNAYGSRLEKMNQDLSLDKDYMLEVEHIARLGQVTWIASAKDVLINQIVMDLIGVKQSKISLESLLEYVNPDDMARIKKELDTMHTDKSFTTFKYRIMSPDKNVHSMISLCKIKRDSKGVIMRVVCTAQDLDDAA